MASSRVPRGAANSRDWLLYCIIAAASFTSGIWFARSAFPTAGREAYDDAAHADARNTNPAAVPASRPEGPRTSEEPAAPDGTWGLDEFREQYRAVAARVASSQHEISQLRDQLAVARGQLARAPSDPSGDSQPPAAALRNPLDATFYPASPEELGALAKSCTVRIDQPELLDSTPGTVGQAADAMSATGDEVRAMNEVMRELHASFRDRLRDLYSEAMGHPPDNELSPRAMLGEFRDKRPPEAAGLLATVARERAGEIAPPASLADASAYERAQRMYFALGDEFQSRVAQVLGPERASVLRAASGGWKWSRSQFTGCEQ